jgi:hypothetical protein
MKSLVAIITAIGALSLADRALGWSLLIAGVALIFGLVVLAVFPSQLKDDAQEVLRILLGRPRG